MVEETERLTTAPFFVRLGIRALGVLANQVQVWAFNWLLYPLIIWQLGLVVGGLMMLALSALICYALLRFYDWTQKDWLGIETIKELKEGQANSGIRRLSSWMLQEGDFAAMLFLSIKFDPFITTAYMRRGSHQFNGLSRRDWRIFFSSLLIGDIYWALAVFTGISFFEWLWQRVSAVV